jgi:hypothetical protein
MFPLAAKTLSPELYISDMGKVQRLTANHGVALSGVKWEIS